MGVGTPFIAYDLNYGPAEVIRHQIDGLLMHQATSRLWGNLPEAQASAARLK